MFAHLGGNRLFLVTALMAALLLFSSASQSASTDGFLEGRQIIEKAFKRHQLFPYVKET